MLTLLLATALSVQIPAQPPAQRTEAERLARSGSYQEALERFRSLAAADPGDLDARTWIARLHIIMGHLQQGEDVYRSVLMDAPDRLDALVGLGSTLVAEGQLEEAQALLARAEKMAPNDLEVLAAQGSLNLAANRSRLAAGYYGRATLIAPEQNDLRLNFEEAHRQYDHRFEATYFNEMFSDATPDSQSGEVSVNLRVTDIFRVMGRGQQARRFADIDTRGGGGVEWQLDRRSLSSATAYGLVGPNNVVLPRLETGAALTWLRRKATVTAGGRYFRFENAQMWAVGPSVRLELGSEAMLAASITRTVSSFTGFMDRIGAYSGDVRAGLRVHPRLWLEAGYARGIENFDRVTVDRVGRFPAHTISGTAHLTLHSLTTLAGTYEYQRIEGGLKMGRLTARVIQSF